jgi:hypothetical protein
MAKAENKAKYADLSGTIYFDETDGEFLFRPQTEHDITHTSRTLREIADEMDRLAAERAAAGK